MAPELWTERLQLVEGCSPCVQERVDPRQVPGPKPIKPVQVPAFDTLRETVVINCGHTMPWLDQQPLECVVIEVRHDMVIEHRLAAPVQHFVGENATHFAMRQDLESKIRMLDFGGKAEEKFPQIDIRHRSANRDPGHGGAYLVGLDGNRRSLGTDKLKLSPALRAGWKQIAAERHFVDLSLVEPVGYPV